MDQSRALRSRLIHKCQYPPQLRWITGNIPFKIPIYPVTLLCSLLCSYVYFFFFLFFFKLCVLCNCFCLDYPAEVKSKSLIKINGVWSCFHYLVSVISVNVHMSISEKFSSLKNMIITFWVICPSCTANGTLYKKLICMYHTYWPSDNNPDNLSFHRCHYQQILSSSITSHRLATYESLPY